MARPLTMREKLKKIQEEANAANRTRAEKDKLKASDVKEAPKTTQPRTVKEAQKPKVKEPPKQSLSVIDLFKKLKKRKEEYNKK